MTFHDVLETATIYTFGAALLSLPLLLFAKIRPFYGLAVLYMSYLWGLYVWLSALFYLLHRWGWLPVVIGFFLGGVGVVPVAAFMGFIHGDVGNPVFFLAASALVIAARYLAATLAD